MAKKWYKSKTIWVNIAAIASTAIANQLAQLIQPYLQVLILAGINIVIRSVTRESIEFR